jgi:ribosomal protein S18 acetylase RimI-like enzyme
MRIRQLVPGDEAALETFLVQHQETSMFLRANVRAAGLVDRGEVRQGTYFAVFEGAAIVAVAAHAWNGSVLVQASRYATEVTRAALTATGREVAVISGPHAHVQTVLTGLGLGDGTARTDSKEKLYALSLSDLRVPRELATGALRCRSPIASEVDLLTTWRVEYATEALSLSASVAESRRSLDRMMNERACWVLTATDDAPLAFSAFNATLPDIVQVGGVWTPPASRGRGFGRSVVAGSLIEARDRGVARAILFTSEANVAAQRAYEALGFREIGTYGLVLFQKPEPLSPTQRGREAGS